MSAEAPKDFRVHGMDALRVLAIALVLVWHAAFPYSRVKLPDLEWLVFDRRGSLVYDALIWWCMCIAMPLFFFLAGFNAAKLHSLGGTRAFIRNRVTHIVKPFIFIGGALLPVIYLVWSWGWIASGRLTPHEMWTMNPDDPLIKRNLLGPGHLWFLEYLVVMYAVFLLSKKLPFKLPGAAALSPVAPFLFALPTAAVLYFRPEPFYDFHNSFIPDPFRLAYNGLYFLGGVCLFAERRGIGALGRRAAAHLMLSVLTFSILLRYLPAHLTVPLEGAQRGGFAVSIALTAWALIFGLTGLAEKLCTRESPRVRYLSDASYWVYLVHFPIVGFFQLMVFNAELPSAVKFLTAFAGATAFSLLSYRFILRFRWASAVTRQKAAGAASRTHSAGGVVLNAKGEVLVVSQHGNSWSLPKGHIDPGEDALAAAKREIYEESGISELIYIGDLGSYERHRIGKSGGDDTSEIKHMRFFLFRTTQTELKPIDPHNPEARWVRPEKVAGMLTHKKDKAFISGIIDVIREARR